MFYDEITFKFTNGTQLMPELTRLSGIFSINLF